MTPSDDDQPATKADLHNLESRVRAELASKDDVETMLDATRRALVQDLGEVVQRALGINAEQFAAGVRGG